ncbi:MAG TPA: SufS family cysteine desulfurase [Acidobacteriota bacterium]|nr:SufS family cysteine desulfurase [Acidobacteriota bacterium]
MFDPQTLKKDFPIFERQPALVYLDSAATALKPQAVIDAEREYLSAYPANVGRGLYPLAETATGRFEAVRAKTARFIGAQEKEIIFVSGTTDAINTAARLIGSSVKPDAAIITTELEHHSNFLPWKELAKRTGAAFRIAPIDAEGGIDTAALLDLVDERTALVAFSAVSNVTGAINDVPGIIKAIRAKHPETIIVVDAAQAIAHMPVDVSSWDADLVAFSAHKAFGPTGVGVLYGKAALLETLSPVSFGGGMVLDASSDTPTYKEIPYRFEAGTPNIGGVIAWGTALGYIESIGRDSIHTHETALAAYAIRKLKESFGDAIRIIGPADPEKRSGIISFSLEGIHPHDIAHLLGEAGICVRAGEHCAAPLHRALGLTATTRLSFSVYNSEKDIDIFIEELKKIKTILNGN